MDDTYEYKIVEKEDFLNQYSSIKSVINGQGKKIAADAGVAYHTYRNAVAGKINNPAILGSILRACKIAHKEIIEQFSKRQKDVIG